MRAWKYSISIVFLALLVCAMALANTSYNLGGTILIAQVQVVDFQKDAELIGMSKSRLEEALKARLQKHKINVDAEKSRPAFVLKVTTLDVGPRVASHITLELKELARIPRHKNNLTFVTTWSRASMVASEPTKHENIVVKSALELVDLYVRESLQ